MSLNCNKLFRCVLLLSRQCTSAIWIFAGVGLGFGQTLQLPSPEKELTVAGAFVSQRTFPITSNGYLISFSRVSSDNANQIVLYSLSTGAQQQIAFSLKNSSATTIIDAAVLSPSNVLVVGTYVASTDGTQQNFVSEVDFSGTVQTTFMLGVYTPERVCAASDGTLWTLGQQLADEGGPYLSYDMLRNYQVDGSLVRSYLPRGALPNVMLDLHPAGSVFGQEVDRAFLACGESSVGVYIANPARIWLEIDMATGKSQQWTVKTLAGSIPTGLTLTSAGTVYASFFFGKQANRKLYNLSLGSSNPAVWEEVTDPSNLFATILGRDGAAIVYIRGSEAPALNPIINWSTPQ